MSDVITPVESSREGVEQSGVYEIWIRRFFMAVLLAVVVLALCNVVGQRATTATAHSATADLTVHAPTRVRPGLLFQAKLTILAHQALPKVTLVLGSGWINGLTLNTAEPSPSTQTSGPGGSLILSLGSLRAGQTFVQYLDYQVNPTSLSSRRQLISVESNGAPLVSVLRTMTIVP
jgi:hypothetical protein